MRLPDQASIPIPDPTLSTIPVGPFWNVVLAAFLAILTVLVDLIGVVSSVRFSHVIVHAVTPYSVLHVVITSGTCQSLWMYIGVGMSGLATTMTSLTVILVLCLHC